MVPTYESKVWNVRNDKILFIIILISCNFSDYFYVLGIKTKKLESKFNGATKYPK